MYHCISYYISAVASHTNMWHKEMKVNHKTYKLQFILTYFIWRIIYTSVERTWSCMSMNQVCIRNDKLQIPIKVNINGKYSCTRILIHVYIAKVHNIHCLSLATHEVFKLTHSQLMWQSWGAGSMQLEFVWVLEAFNGRAVPKFWHSCTSCTKIWYSCTCCDKVEAHEACS